MWVGVEVVKYLVARGFGECGGRGLFARNLVDRGEDGRIDSTTVVEKGAGDGLNSLGSFLVKG